MYRMLVPLTLRVKVTALKRIQQYYQTENHQNFCMEILIVGKCLCCRMVSHHDWHHKISLRSSSSSSMFSPGVPLHQPQQLIEDTIDKEQRQYRWGWLGYAYILYSFQFCKHSSSTAKYCFPYFVSVSHTIVSLWPQRFTSWVSTHRSMGTNTLDHKTALGWCHPKNPYGIYIKSL